MMEALRDAMEEYQASLSDLTFNSKPHINALTMLAEEDMEYAEHIVKLIEARMNEVSDDGKLPVMYLMDSIVKNVGGNYKPHFARNLVKTFLQAFKAGSDKTKMSLYKLRTTWDDYFPLKRLYELDNHVKKMDPNWPVKDLPAHLHDKQTKSIHVNPKFLKPDATSTIISSSTKATSPAESDLTQDLINKQKQLLELQSQKLMLELEQTKQQLAKRERRQQIQKKMDANKDPRSKNKPDFSMKRELNSKSESIPAKSKKADTGNKTQLSQRFNKNKQNETGNKKSPELKSKKSPTLNKNTNKLKSENSTAAKTTKKKKSQGPDTPEKDFVKASPKNIKEMRIPKKRPNAKESPPAQSKKGIKTVPQNPAKKRSTSPGRRIIPDGRKRERFSTKSSEGSESPRFSSESESDNGKQFRGWRPPAPKRPRPQPKQIQNPMQHAPDFAHRRISIEEDVEIPQELSLSHQREILLQADRQLRNGQLTHEQHQEMLRQLHQIFELQNLRNDEEHDEQPNVHFNQRQNFAKDPRQRRGGNVDSNQDAARINRDPRKKELPPKRAAAAFEAAQSKNQPPVEDERILEEPEDYIIASMTPSSEAYQKHSLSLRRSSTEDKAYREHKKKILVSKYNKQLNPENSSGVESDDKEKSDASDNSLAKETKDVISSPTLPLKKRKYKSSENESETNSVVSVDQNKTEESSTAVESESGKENNDEQYLPDIIRSMTPPPLPDLNEITEIDKKRSSSLPLEENIKFNDQTRKKRKYRQKDKSNLDDDSPHDSTPELRNSQEPVRPKGRREHEEDKLYNQLMMEEQQWESYEMEQRKKLELEHGRRPFRGQSNRGRSFRGEHAERRGTRGRGRGRVPFRPAPMGGRGLRERPGPPGPDRRDRFGPMRDRPPLRGERPGPGWEDEMHWDGPPMRRSPNIHGGPNEPPGRMNRPRGCGFSPPRRQMHRGGGVRHHDRDWHDDRARRGHGPGPPLREWDNAHPEYRPQPQHFPDPRDRSGPAYRPAHVDHPPHDVRHEPMRPETDRNSPVDPRRPPHQPNMPPPHKRAPSPPPAREEPPPAEINQLNVNKLLSDLQLMGILPGQRSIKPEKPVTKSNSRPQSPVATAPSAPVVAPEPDSKPSIEDELLNMNPDTDLPEVDINNLENLKIRHNEIINRLYTGIQCSACGMRFTARQTDVYAEHLDWHYRLNRKDKEGQVQSHREFYPTAGGWIMYEEIDDPLKRNKSQLFDENAEEDEGSRGAAEAGEDMEENTVPVTGKENEDICQVCKESFETVYNEEEDEWQFLNCVKVNDETFHPHCYGDHQSSNDELHPLPTPVRVPLFNPLADALETTKEPEEKPEPMQPIKLELTASSPENPTKSPVISENISENITVEEVKVEPAVAEPITIKTEKTESEEETVLNQPDVEATVSDPQEEETVPDVGDGESTDHNNTEDVSNLNLDENKICDSLVKAPPDNNVENDKSDSSTNPNQVSTEDGNITEAQEASEINKLDDDNNTNKKD